MTRNVLILTAASFCWGLACAAAQPRSPLKQIEALLDDCTVGRVPGKLF